MRKPNIRAHEEERLQGEGGGEQQCQTMDGIIAKREHLFLWITDRAATSAKTQD